MILTSADCEQSRKVILYGSSMGIEEEELYMQRQTLGLPTNLFHGLSIYSGTKQGVIDFATHLLEESPREGGAPVTIFTPNPEQLVLSRENSNFYQVLQRADVLLPDGAGLIWAIDRKIQNSKSKIQRVSGREVFHDLLEVAKAKHSKVFLLGGKKGAAKNLLSLDWQVDDGPKENRGEILKKIAEYRPDLLFVAYGAPDQERFVIENRDALGKAGVRVAMVVGGAFEYEAGFVPRVPQLVQDLHLEWLFRLVSEPWRWKRQLKGARFFLDVILGKYT